MDRELAWGSMTGRNKHTEDELVKDSVRVSESKAAMNSVLLPNF